MFAVRPMFSGQSVWPVSPLGCQGVTYSAEDMAPGSASVTLTIKSNGTWEVTGSPAVVGSPTSGNWLSPPSDGSSYSVRFTRTAFSGDGSSPSSGWLSLASNRSVVCISSAIEGWDSDSGRYTIEISSDGGTTIVSTTTGVVLATSVLP